MRAERKGGPGMSRSCSYCQNSKAKKYPAWHCSCCDRHLREDAMHYVMSETGPVVWGAQCHDAEQRSADWWRRRSVTKGGSRAWVHAWLERPFETEGRP